MNETIFSPDKDGPDGRGKYRYTLWRENLQREYELFGNACLDRANETCMFIGLNPSTATEMIDDPTIRRCTAFARGWGYGTYLMMNLFAYRATDPAVMKRAPHPIGPANDQLLLHHADRAGRVVVAWGKHGNHHNRADRVADLLHKLGVPLWCLRMNKDGSPEHPLYVPAETPITKWR